MLDEIPCIRWISTEALVVQLQLVYGNFDGYFTSKALNKEEAPTAWSEIIALGLLPAIVPQPSSPPRIGTIFTESFWRASPRNESRKLTLSRLPLDDTRRVSHPPDKYFQNTLQTRPIWQRT
jgi:hypothetical protein